MDRRCRESEGKAKIEGYMSVSDEEAHQRGVFLGQIEEGAGDVGVIADEFSVEVGKSKERMDVLYLSRGGPVSDPIEFSGIHFNVVPSCLSAQALYCLNAVMSLLIRYAHIPFYFRFSFTFPTRRSSDLASQNWYPLDPCS